MIVKPVTALEIEAQLEQFAALLQNAVANGASIGFMAPLSAQAASDYWQEVMASVAHGHKVLLAAHAAGGRMAGAVQLMLESRANGIHRAEVQKLMVHTDFRRRGIGRMLMEALHVEAHRAGRTLIVLDTRSGDVAERLYQQLGYTLAGTIPGYARSTTGSLTGTSFYYLAL